MLDLTVQEVEALDAPAGWSGPSASVSAWPSAPPPSPSPDPTRRASHVVSTVTPPTNPGGSSHMIDTVIPSELSLHAEELESLDALAWDWGHFIAGAALGVALVGLAVT
jgi:hypothetical protein